MKSFTAEVNLDEWLELHPWRERRFAVEGNRKKKTWIIKDIIT